MRCPVRPSGRMAVEMLSVAGMDVGCPTLSASLSFISHKFVTAGESRKNEGLNQCDRTRNGCIITENCGILAEVAHGNPSLRIH